MREHELLVALAILRGLARHQLELVHSHDYTDHARLAIMQTVAEYTPGISPHTRAEQWSTFVATFEVLADIDDGANPTLALLTAANKETGDPLDHYEWTHVRDTAMEEQSGALELLFAGRRVLTVVSA